MQFWRSWLFFVLNVQTLSPQTPKKIEIDSLFEKKISPDVVHLDAEVAVLTSMLKIIGRKFRNFVQNEENNIKNQIIRSKNRFRQLLFYQRRPFFDNTAGSFPLTIQRKQRKWKFHREKHFLEIVSLEGNKAFSTIVPGNFR